MTKEQLSRFSLATSLALLESSDLHSVGTLGEKTIHRTLKYFIEPDITRHEVKHDGFILDVMNECGIFEIQTRSFDRLVPKLSSFLDGTSMTVVYPVIKERRLFWINPEDGSTDAPRKVSKKGKLSDILPELSKIKEFIGNNKLTVCIYVLEADEYRMLDGYGAEKKKRATKFKILPTNLLQIYEFKSVKDYSMILPEAIPSEFSAKQFYSAIGMRGRRAYFALSFCLEIGLIKKVGKQGKAYIYKKDY